MKRKGGFDYILLETSGVADPGPIADMFWLDDALKSSIYLDGIVTVMDAQNIIKSFDDVSVDTEHHGNINHEAMSTALIQVAHADVLILNKIDTLQQDKHSHLNIDTIRSRILSVNSSAPLIETSFCDVPLKSILDLHAYDGVLGIDSVSNGWHDHRITTVSVEFPPLNTHQRELLDSWIQTVLWENQMAGNTVEIHRLKGRIISTEGHMSIIQGVRETYEWIEPTEQQPNSSNKESFSTSKLVFIGKNLTEAMLKESVKEWIK